MDDKCFEKFVFLLEEKKVYLNTETTFEDICEMSGTTAGEMDEFIFETFGLRGNEILELYRSGRPIYFL